MQQSLFTSCWKNNTEAGIASSISTAADEKNARSRNYSQLASTTKSHVPKKWQLAQTGSVLLFNEHGNDALRVIHLKYQIECKFHGLSLAAVRIELARLASVLLFQQGIPSAVRVTEARQATNSSSRGFSVLKER